MRTVRAWLQSTRPLAHINLAPPILSVELRPPFPFQAGLHLSDVDVRLLLEGLFASEIANQGDLDAYFSLQGELQNLIALVVYSRLIACTRMPASIKRQSLTSASG